MNSTQRSRRDEFKALFLPYGEIEHAVILAVLDNFSRRRGFVVFSSHTQARTAMRAVHKTTVKFVIISLTSYKFSTFLEGIS